VILVAGGTGLLGSEIVRRLLEAGAPVRVMTRAAERAAPLRSLGADVVVADLRDTQTLAAAVRGTTTVIAAAHGFAGTDAAGPDAVDRDGNAALIAAAAEAGTRHFVLLSGYGASAESPMALFRAKHDAEQALRASGLSWTIIRPTSFMETWLGLVGDPLVEHGRTQVFGRGRNPINFVSIQDVAAVAVAATLDGADGAVIDAAGPENVTFDDFAATALRVSGRTGAAKIRHVPRTMLRTMTTVLGPVRPVIAGQIRAALAMDTLDMTAPLGGAERRRLDAVARERYA
jgi:uncharacterized protein YbjT (DUF2867 family)